MTPESEVAMDQLTPDILRNYDVPTPRYTSYPTALSFQPLESAPPPRPGEGPVSLYFHMVFCRSMCWYCACTKEVTRQQARSGSYLDRVLTELEMRSESLSGRQIVQLHLGGGTPTFFTATELAALTRFVRDRFHVAEDAELSVEIDPRDLRDEQVAALASAGYGRASLGVQDHDPRVQTAINRHQPLSMTADAVARLRQAGIESINFDLVYGLPHQTPDSFRRTAEDIVALRPDRLAVYSYAHVPWAAPAQKLVTRNVELPDADAKIRMFLAATDVFESAGYRHVGMDHFALPQDSLTQALDAGTMRRNFMGYTTQRGTDIHGFGVSAISQTDEMYFQNARTLTEWESKIDARELPTVRGIELTAEDRLRREVIMTLMCSNAVDFATVGTPFGVDALEHFAAEIRALGPLLRDQLVEFDRGVLKVTELGRFLVRNVASVFDPSRSSVAGYSRAV